MYGMIYSRMDGAPLDRRNVRPIYSLCAGVTALKTYRPAGGGVGVIVRLCDGLPVLAVGSAKAGLTIYAR